MAARSETPGKRGGWLAVAALVTAAGALAFWTTARRHRVWLKHRRAAIGSGDEAVEPKPGDILLFHHIARLRDLLITMVTHSPFYHAALYAGDGCVVEARPQGVIENDLRGREQNIVVLPAPEGKGEAALAWARTQLGDPFDRMDLFVIFLEHVFRHWHINYAPYGRYTCAELVTKAFLQAGVRLVPDKEPSEVAPADLARLLPPAVAAA